MSHTSTSLKDRLYKHSRFVLRNRRGRQQVQKLAIDCNLEEYKCLFNCSELEWSKVVKKNNKLQQDLSSIDIENELPKRSMRRQLHKKLYRLAEFVKIMGWSFFYFFYGSTAYKLIHMIIVIIITTKLLSILLLLLLA